jgi:hypothetical protein
MYVVKLQAKYQRNKVVRDGGKLVEAQQGCEGFVEAKLYKTEKVYRTAMRTK